MTERNIGVLPQDQQPTAELDASQPTDVSAADSVKILQSGRVKLSSNGRPAIIGDHGHFSPSLQALIEKARQK